MKMITVNKDVGNCLLSTMLHNPIHLAAVSLQVSATLHQPAPQDLAAAPSTSLQGQTSRIKRACLASSDNFR